MSKLTDEEIRKIIKVKLDTLKLIRLNEKHYLEVLGKSGLHELINQTLDDYNYWRKQLINDEGEK